MTAFNYRGAARRENVLYDFVDRVGRSSARLDCPFCGLTITVYLWSISGGGKRCSCGAMHTWGTSFREVPPAFDASDMVAALDWLIKQPAPFYDDKPRIVVVGGETYRIVEETLELIPYDSEEGNARCK